jgi:hypothetical protein
MRNGSPRECDLVGPAAVCRSKRAPGSLLELSRAGRFRQIGRATDVPALVSVLVSELRGYPAGMADRAELSQRACPHMTLPGTEIKVIRLQAMAPA